jgi:hypothetical protein
MAAPHICAQASSVRVKVARQQKSGTSEGAKTIFYKIDVSALSGGQTREVEVKWGLLVQSDRYMYSYSQSSGRAGSLRAVTGERNCTVEPTKSCSFETDVLELRGSSKVLGYAVEVFINGERVAADIQPPDTKSRIEQAVGEGEQKRHQF